MNNKCCKDCDYFREANRYDLESTNDCTLTNAYEHSEWRYSPHKYFCDLYQNLPYRKYIDANLRKVKGNE